MLNLGGAERRFAPANLDLRGAIALTTALDREGEPVAGAVTLRGDEGVIVALQP